MAVMSLPFELGVWSEILTGKGGCDRLKEGSSKRKRSQSSNLEENISDEEVSQPAKPKKKRTSAQEDREECVQSTIEQLKEKHGSTFTPIQVRIWSEMISITV